MADTGSASDRAMSTSSAPSPPEDQQLLPAQGTVKNTQNSTGACDACRLRKVRCLANESSSSSKCQRCARANRECVYTTHSKTRRRKRTDTRVKELEEKVRGLSMLLENGGKGSSMPSILEKESDTMTQDEGSRRNTPINGAVYGSTGGICPVEELSLFDYSSGESRRQFLDIALQDWDQYRKAPELTAILPDVIDQGILSMDMAEKLYNRYLNELMPQSPVLPLSCTAMELRKEKPVLFLAVLAAGAGSADPALNLRLNQEIQQLYAKRVSIQGRKSLELVQALCVSVIWTYPPEKMEELKFHQQIQMAATMAMDIGLGKRPKPLPDTISYLPGDVDSADIKKEERHPVISAKPPRIDSSTLESRRALLACYVFCTSVSMSLRLPNMLRFTSWMAECVEVLRTSPNAAPTDKAFIAWVELQRIVEDCAMNFGLDSDETVSLADERTQLKLKTTEKQLEAWRRENLCNDDIKNFQTLEIAYHINQVYLHEIALHPDHDAEDFRPPFSITSKPTSQTKITPAYINAILICVSSSESLLEMFLTNDAETIRAMPTMAYARVIYCVVILMKLSISSSVPSSELSKILDPQDLNVDYYLGKILVQLGAVATLDNQGKHVLASQFLNILSKLKMWYDSLKRQQAPKNDQKVAFDPKQQQNGVPGPNSMPGNGTRFLPRSATFGLAEEDYDFSKPPWSNGESFFTDFSKGPGDGAHDSPDTQSMRAPLWPNQLQQNFNYSEVESLFPSSNIPFDFPMEVDPNMFTHFMDAGISQNGQTWLPTEGSGMAYTNMPEFNWGNASS